jgi:hypothetical protein
MNCLIEEWNGLNAQELIRLKRNCKCPKCKKRRFNQATKNMGFWSKWKTKLLVFLRIKVI